MRSAWAPYRQIGGVIWRSFGFREGRWAYLALACCAVLVVVGGGVALDASVQSILTAATTGLALGLQLAWIIAMGVLQTLNHPNAARTTPHHVASLRLTALGLWLAVCLATALLSSGTLGLRLGLVSACAAGAFMLFISAAPRWPVRWFVCIIVIPLLARYNPESLQCLVEGLTPESPRFQGWLPLALLMAMAWLVTRLIARAGSSTSVLALDTRLHYAKPNTGTNSKPFVQPLGFVRAYLMKVWQWLNFPWRYYVRRLLSAPKSTPVNVLARAELAFGAELHWVRQAILMAVLPGFIVLGVGVSALTLDTSGTQALTPWSLLLAFWLLMLAIDPVSRMQRAMLETTLEQKLMLLLPGMPRGAELNRLLAVRLLRQCLVAWLFAAAIALMLPYRDALDAMLVGALYAGGSLLLPGTVNDWARIKAPTGRSVLRGLFMIFIVPGAACAGMRWFNVSGLTVGLITLAIWSTLMTSRWRRLAHFPQALPAGRLASSRP